jgi:hypothetical protein
MPLDVASGWTEELDVRVPLFFTRESDVGPGRGLNRRPDPR